MSWRTIQLLKQMGESWGDVLRQEGARRDVRKQRAQQQYINELAGRFISGQAPGLIPPREGVQEIDPVTGKSFAEVPERAGGYYATQFQAKYPFYRDIAYSQRIKERAKVHPKGQREKDYYNRYKTWYSQLDKVEEKFQELPDRTQLNKIYNIIGKAKDNVKRLSDRYNKQEMLDELERRKKSIEEFAFKEAGLIPTKKEKRKTKVKEIQQRLIKRTKKDTLGILE